MDKLYSRKDKVDDSKLLSGCKLNLALGPVGRDGSGVEAAVGGVGTDAEHGCSHELVGAQRYNKVFVQSQVIQEAIAALDSGIARRVLLRVAAVVSEDGDGAGRGRSLRQARRAWDTILTEDCSYSIVFMFEGVCVVLCLRNELTKL